MDDPRAALTAMSMAPPRARAYGRSMSPRLLGLLLPVLGFAAGCAGADEGGSNGGAGGGSSNGATSGGQGASSTTGSASQSASSAGSTTSAASGGTGGKQAICEAYAQLVIDCCDPPVPNCAPDKQQGWVDFCLQGYEGCPKAYDCLATATCATKDQCPNFGSGCQ